MTVKRKHCDLIESNELELISITKKACKFKNIFTLLFAKAANRVKTEKINEITIKPEMRDSKVTATEKVSGKKCCNCIKASSIDSSDGFDCYFCERFVCSDCIQLCARCANHFCQFCSVKNYDKTEVQYFCHSCYTN